jgi:nucleoside 2-deoxyribosyltransferase
MPQVGVTVYSLLVSCPGDVANLLPHIDKVVNSFNETIGQVNNVRVEVKHWSRSGYPDTGAEPQALLNKQFIDDCDFCVALLGTRFGTPTENYDSGTEEEIESMISSGKHVLLYFVERSIDPSKIDLKQYQKVKDYKNKFEQERKGSYWIVKSGSEFERLFTNHLSMVMLNEINKEDTVKLNSNDDDDFPQLSIEQIKYDVHSNYAESVFIADLDNKIQTSIQEINGINLPIVEVEEAPKEEKLSGSQSNKANSVIIQESGRVLKKAISPISDLLKNRPVVIKEEDRKIIQDYCAQNEIELSNDFWNLSDLMISSLSFTGRYSGPTYSGSDEAQDKYHKIRELISNIRQRNSYLDYFKSLDSLYRIAFCVKNDGTHFDEDLDISLYIPAGLIVEPSSLPVPDIMICEDVNKGEYYNLFFVESSSPDYTDYSNTNPDLSDYSTYLPELPFSTKTVEEEYEEEKNQYNDNVKYIFDYSIFPACDSQEADIWKFNIRYLKQHTKMYLPSILFFKKLPDKIGYEITSKYSKDVVKGEISIEDGED